ncbi:MAG TPA: M48 family metallopeptidase, partial [Polyangiaceae bacterium]
AIGHVPIKLLFISGLVVIYTLLAIYRSLTTRVTDRDPGTKLDLGTEPRLAAVLAETAASVGTRPVDAVYLVADTRVAVTERGGFVKQLRGQGERALILGVGALDGLTVRPLKAVLAHEYGHFRNEDTAGGGVALAARRSLQLMALHMAMRGVATWYNPAWWFVRGYDAAYLRISQGASRLQEVLADRWAVLGYGADAFVTGLRHVVTRSIAFDHHLDVSIKEAIEDKSAIANLYTHTPKAAPSNESLAKEVDEEWNKKPSPYDSHPRGADREAWARAFGATGASLAADDAEPAWSLFHDRAALERAMTDEVRGAIAKRHGITIAAE